MDAGINQQSANYSLQATTGLRLVVLSLLPDPARLSFWLRLGLELPFPPAKTCSTRAGTCSSRPSISNPDGSRWLLRHRVHLNSSQVVHAELEQGGIAIDLEVRLHLGGVSGLALANEFLD